jgi:hypothetical protein
VPIPPGETRAERYQRPRESDLWPDSVRAVGSLGQATRVVHVTDRGGDDFETIMSCRTQENVGFLIRARHNRWVNGRTDKLWSFLGKQPVAGYRDVPVEGGMAEEQRIARLSIRYASTRPRPIRSSRTRSTSGWRMRGRNTRRRASTPLIGCC